MTANKTIYKKSITYTQFVSSAMVCFAFALFFRNSHLALDYIKKGLLLCANTIIPSLFPFMVLSEIAISAGIGDVIGKYLKRPMSRLFGVSGSGACAFLLGILCGFPVGAKSAVTLYDNGKISKQECEKLIAFCNIPSISFIVNVVGGTALGSSKLGWMFWVSVVISSLIIGMINNLFCKKKDKKINIEFEENVSENKFCAGSFVRAIESSAKSTLIICAYVIFFSSLMGTIKAPLEFFCVPELLRVIICGFLEMTTGTAECITVQSLPLRALFCAFFVGWSGLSVHFQIFSICEGRNLHFKNYLSMKLLQGLICVAIVSLFFGFVSWFVS